MAVVLKRTKAAKAEQEREQQEQATAERAERMRICAEQLVRYREEAERSFTRFARGWLLYLEKGWEWEEPDYSVNPEEWPPLAKLVWLYDRGYSAMGAAQWLSHMRESPGWCPSCHPEEERMPKGWHFMPCLDHNVLAVVGHLAAALGWAGWRDDHPAEARGWRAGHGDEQAEGAA